MLKFLKRLINFQNDNISSRKARDLDIYMSQLRLNPQLEKNNLEKLAHALCLAAELGKTESFLEIISVAHENASELIKIKNRFNGCNALHIAASKGNFEICDLLLEIDPQLINSTTNRNCRETPLHIAAYFDQKQICERLLQATENKYQAISKKDGEGYNSLQIAAILGKKEICQIFVEAAKQQAAELIAEENSTYGLNAFHFAAQEGHTSICEDFLRISPQLNRKLSSKDGKLPVYYAASAGFSETAQFLERKILTENKENRTAKFKLNMLGIFDQSYGALALLLEEENIEIKQGKILQVITLLSLVDEKYIDKISTSQNEVANNDPLLTKTINEIAQNFDSADQESISQVFHYLIHQIYYDKPANSNSDFTHSLKLSEAESGFTGEDLEIVAARYFKGFDEEFNPTIYEDILIEEIRKNLFASIAQEKEKLIEEYLKISAPLYSEKPSRKTIEQKISEIFYAAEIEPAPEPSFAKAQMLYKNLKESCVIS